MVQDNMESFLSERGCVGTCLLIPIQSCTEFVTCITIKCTTLTCGFCAALGVCVGGAHLTHLWETGQFKTHTV
uniref:Uncharacterized protein n=1 Tax=Anguilla anguilla TaxID=7936 RepID=A0A0E9QM82_ANGAN